MVVSSSKAPWELISILSNCTYFDTNPTYLHSTSSRSRLAHHRWLHAPYQSSSETLFRFLVAGLTCLWQTFAHTLLQVRFKNMVSRFDVLMLFSGVYNECPSTLFASGTEKEFSERLIGFVLYGARSHSSHNRLCYSLLIFLYIYQVLQPETIVWLNPPFCCVLAKPIIPHYHV